MRPPISFHAICKPIKTDRRQQRRSFSQLRLEPLEDRCLLSSANIWSAAGAAGVWSDTANWSLGHVPTSTEVATFDNTSQAACVIDVAASASGIDMAATHTGTVTAGVDVKIGADGFVQGGGTFSAVTFTITDAGDWSESSATGFDAGTGTVDFTGATGVTQLLNSGGSAFNDVTHSGAGTLQLTTNALTVNGALSNNAGTLEVDGLNLNVSGLTTISTSTLQNSTIQNSGASDTLTLTGGLSMMGSASSGALAVLSTGVGTAVLGADVSSANWAIIAGRLDLGGVNRTFTVANIGLNIKALVSNGGITKDGSGILFLSHVNFYSGGTLVNAGELDAAVDGALGPGTGGTTVSSGASLLIEGVTYGIPEPVTLNGGSFGGATTTFAGSITLGAAGSSIRGGMLTQNGPINAQGFDLSIDGTVIFNAPISGTSSASLTIMGSNNSDIVTLNGANTYGGGTMVKGGTLAIGNDSAVGTGTLTMKDGTTLAGAGKLANNVVLDGFVTIGYSADLAINGMLTGSGGVIGGNNSLLVNGILTLNGGCAFNGSAVSGSLTLDGSNNSLGGCEVRSGGTLTGNASIVANLIVDSGGTVVPASQDGTLPGVLMTGALTLNGGTIKFIANSPTPGSAYSQIQVNGGNVSLGSGGATLQLSGSWIPHLADKLRLIDNQGSNPITGFFKGLPERTTENDPNFGRLLFSYQGGDGNDMVVTKVEEVLAGRVSSTGQWWLGQSDGSTFTNFPGPTWSTSVTWVDVHTGDFNGDGHDDLVGRALQTGQWWVSLSDGSGGFTTSLWGAWSPSVTWVDVKVGRFTNNGPVDIVGRAIETGQWWLAQPTYNSASGKIDMFTSSLWTTWSTAATWVDVQVGDFDGDGTADITGRWLQGGSWWTTLSTSSGQAFDTRQWGQWSPAVTWVDVHMGDFNGDHKDDIIGRAKETGQWWVGLSTGSPFNESFANSLWANWSTAATWVDVQVGDFNGDGKADITGRWLEAGSWWTAISNGSTFSTTKWGQWSTAATWVDVQVGDFNGDGKADITSRWLQAGSWWTAESTGTSFVTAQWTQWSTAVNWVDVQTGVYA